MKKILILLCFICMSCSQRAILQANYVSGHYNSLDEPQELSTLEKLKTAVQKAKFMLTHRRHHEKMDHDRIVNLLCLSYIAMGRYYKARGDYLKEEEIYLKAIEQTKHYGVHLPYTGGGIYQSIKSTYRKELIKRHCYFLLMNFYRRLMRKPSFPSYLCNNNFQIYT